MKKSVIVTMFFNLKNSRTGQIKRIIVIIDPEANKKDE